VPCLTYCYSPFLGPLLGLFFPHIFRGGGKERGGSAIGPVGVFEGLFEIGFIMGPMLGGLLASYEERLPYVVMGLITLAPYLPQEEP